MTDKKKVIFITLFILESLALAFLDELLPNAIGISGIKLGLTNIITITTLIFFSFSDTLLIIIVHCVFLSLLNGGPISFMFSITGGILSAAVMLILLKCMQNLFSIVGISIIGLVVYNIGQILVAGFIMKDLSVQAFLAVLLLNGILIGCFVGFCSTLHILMLKKFRLISNY